MQGLAGQTFHQHCTREDNRKVFITPWWMTTFPVGRQRSWCLSCLRQPYYCLFQYFLCDYISVPSCVISIRRTHRHTHVRRMRGEKKEKRLQSKCFIQKKERNGNQLNGPPALMLPLDSSPRREKMEGNAAGLLFFLLNEAPKLVVVASRKMNQFF